MAAGAQPSLLTKFLPHLRLHLHTTLPAAVSLLIRRPCHTTTASESPPPINNPPPNTPTTHDDKKPSLLFDTKRQQRNPLSKNHNLENDPDYCKWKDHKAQMFLDIGAINLLIKHILHSDRYMDGDRLTPTDEKTVVDKVLAYHPDYEDKIGPGIDSIMVDRHPQFRNSRCLYVVRTDGIWIDFSYHKCIRSYIRQKNILLMEKDL